MPREIKTNRFENAGKTFAEVSQPNTNNETILDKEKKYIEKKKDKIISAKVYQDVYDTFTAINKAQGITNNSAINMLICEYVRNKKEILK